MLATDRHDDLVRDELSALFEAHASRIFGLALVRCGDAGVAEEVTSQTFEAAARQFVQQRGSEVTPAWLTTVALRRLVDHWRRNERVTRAANRLRLRDRAMIFDDHERAEDHDVLDALDSLPTTQRAVLSLRYLEDWSVSEVADAIGHSYRSTESLLVRARSSLRAALRAKGVADV